MNIASDWKDYEILDMANGEKLEKWNNIYLIRPDPQIIWNDEENIKIFRNIYNGVWWSSKKIRKVKEKFGNKLCSNYRKWFKILRLHFKIKRIGVVTYDRARNNEANKKRWYTT